MRLLGIDLETTGLLQDDPRIVKIGLVLKEWGKSNALMERDFTLYAEDYPEEMPEGAFKVNKILMSECQEFGRNPSIMFDELARICDYHAVNYIVAHNGNRFDRIVLEKEWKRYEPQRRFPAIPWLDTMKDIRFPESIKKYGGLTTLAAYHNFLNPFPHNALSDVHTMFKILENYPIEEVITRSKSETITIRAGVDIRTKDLAKNRGYFWDKDSQRWLKEIKECDFEEESKNLPFHVWRI